LKDQRAEKNKILFSHYLLTFVKWVSYIAEDKIKIKIYFWNKTSETGLNTLIFSCFACLGAPYLQRR
jgi:hypothetical protein